MVIGKERAVNVLGNCSEELEVYSEVSEGLKTGHRVVRSLEVRWQIGHCLHVIQRDG